jgi:uncharacterized cupin superfamily protein
MPKIDFSKSEIRRGTNYPAAFQRVVAGREKQPLGNGAGLTQFGVNRTRLKPGAASSLRHWHEKEDEFVYILEGEVVLVEEDGETILKAGDAAGFKAGVPNGHQLINRSNADVVYLEIGSRIAGERAHYPDVDLAMTSSEDRVTFTRKSGEPHQSQESKG